MAASDSRPLPLKNTAFRLYFTAYDSSGVPVTAFTSPDSERSLDGAAFADCTNEATYVGHGQGYIDLTATEMNTDHTGFYFECTEGSTRDCISICPAQNDSLPVNVKQINGTAQTARDIGASVLLSDGTGTGQIDLTNGLVNVATLAANSITSSVIATDAIGNLQVADGFITQAKLNTGCISADALALDAVQEITADVVAAMASAPVGSVAGNVVGNVGGSVGSVSSPGNIADAVCDEALSGHVTAGTLAKALSDVLADTGTDGVVLASTAVDAIWAKTMSDLSAMPAANATALNAVNALYQDMRNKKRQVSDSQITYRDDGTTTAWTRTIDASSSAYVRGEGA